MGEYPTIEEQKEFLARLIACLKRAEIPYVLTGSFGSNIFGEPRATCDLDFLIKPTESHLKTFVEEVSATYYVSMEAALDAFRHQFMFNVIDASIGWKADFIILKNHPYELQKFQRRIRTEYLGIAVEVATPEDVVLSKLVWAKTSDSERQIRDAFGVIAVQGNTLDKSYLRKWAKELQVEDILEKLFQEAENIMG